MLKITKNIVFSYSTRPKIIAEISGNHNGSFKKMKQLIMAAKRSGADLVKIQTYEPKDITFKEVKKHFNLKGGLWKNLDLWKLYKKASTPFNWHSRIFKFAKKNNIILFSSPFSIRAVDLLETLKCPIYKIASLEITDFRLVKKIAKTGKPIIISCGASKLTELRKTIKLINKYHNKIVIMYCRTSYPLVENLSNLDTILNIKKLFKNNFIGYSDHTNKNTTSLISAILGAKVIEKHFIIDNKKTYDSKFSIKPKQLSDLKKHLNSNYDIIGYKKPYLLKDELTKRDYRRSIYAKKDIKKGNKFTSDNIISLRPRVGICSSKYFKLINRKSKKNYLKNSPISKNEVL